MQRQKGEKNRPQSRHPGLAQRKIELAFRGRYFRDPGIPRKQRQIRPIYKIIRIRLFPDVLAHIRSAENRVDKQRRSARRVLLSWVEPFDAICISAAVGGDSVMRSS